MHTEPGGQQIKTALAELWILESGSDVRVDFEQIKKMCADYGIVCDDLSRCLEHGVHSAAIILCWKVVIHVLYKKIDKVVGVGRFSAMMDCLDSKPARLHFSSWSDLNKVKDRQLIGTCHRLGFYDQNVERMLNGMLEQRNSVAHVTERESKRANVGAFISDARQSIETIHGREFGAGAGAVERIRRAGKDSRRELQNMPLITAESCIRELAGEIGSGTHDCKELVSLAKMCVEARPEKERAYLAGALVEELGSA